MSERGFHVHGPHDHEVEHAAAHDRGPFAACITVMTAIFGTIGAFFGHMAGATQNDALLGKSRRIGRRRRARARSSLTSAIMRGARHARA